MVLVGFRGGVAFAGGLLLNDPARYAGTALLYETLPFDAGSATGPSGLTGADVFLAHGERDTVIPRDLHDRTWADLHQGSGASPVARCDPVGHGIVAPALAALSDWLADRLGSGPKESPAETGCRYRRHVQPRPAGGT